MIELLLLAVVVFLFGGLIIAGLGGFLGAWMHSRTEKHAAKELARAPEILDAAFAGDPIVTYRVNLESLPYDVLVQGAMERGYRVASQDKTSQNSSTVVFEKV